MPASTKLGQVTIYRYRLRIFAAHDWRLFQAWIANRVAISGRDAFGRSPALDQGRITRELMKTLKPSLSFLAMVVIGALAGCSMKSARSADVSGGIRTSLDQAGLKAVSVTEDHDKGVVTLGGNVTAAADKSQAESIGKSMAGGQVVSNQIAVIPPGEGLAKEIDLDLDKGIEGNLDAALLQSGFHKNVKYAVNNQVVTMTGEVVSQSKRRQAQDIAAAVPNVLQVVNELQVKEQKATSSN
jgi:osmotically-inducible protein OsmY